MKRLLIAITVVVLVLLAVFASIRFFPFFNKDTQPPNPITRENAKAGTTAWQIPVSKAATIQIQAYANVRSVAPGQQLTLYVSTQQAGTPYTIDIYRMGWYQGKGGREVATSGMLVGQAHRYKHTPMSAQ